MTIIAKASAALAVSAFFVSVAHAAPQDDARNFPSFSTDRAAAASYSAKPATDTAGVIVDLNGDSVDYKAKRATDTGGVLASAGQPEFNLDAITSLFRR